MQPENQHHGAPGDGPATGTVTCPSCHAVMLREMRFCRLCGYRLGEGVEEYTETRLLSDTPPSPPTSGAGRGPAEASNPLPHSRFHQWGGAAAAPRPAPIAVASDHASFSGSSGSTLPLACSPPARAKRMHWIGWLIVFVVLSSAAGGFIFKPISRMRHSERNARLNAPAPFFGEDDFENVEGGGGVMVTAVKLPDSPAARAGLVGGDIVQSFDGQPVREEGELRRLLAATPAGKTVEVVFLRDGEINRTMLTTIARRDFRPIEFDARPEGEGFLGIDSSDLELVTVPGMNIRGVRLDEVYRNRPGYLAGLREGDIVIEFNGVPIRTKKELLSRIDEALPDSTVKAIVIRGRERLEIPVKMGRDD